MLYACQDTIMDIQETEILNIEEVAQLLKVDPQTVRRYIKDKRLPAVYITANTLRFFRSKVIGWLEEQDEKI